MRSRTPHAALALSLSAVLAACLLEDEGGPNHPALQTGTSSAYAVDAGALAAGSDSAADKNRPSHLPCEVEALIRTRCASCHSPSNLPHRPSSLLTYEELLQPSRSLPGMSYAQQAEQLVVSGMMPPTGALPASEVQLYASWVRAGTPQGDCRVDAGSSDAGGAIDDAAANAPDAAPARTDAAAEPIDAGNAADGGDAGSARCSSGSYWRGGDMRSPMMHPGRACITCHTMGAGLFNLQHGPSFTAAGTVYRSAHEPDDCNGVTESGVAIAIEGANGQRISLTPNAAGNFTTLTRIAFPYSAEIQYQGRSRKTLMPHAVGDCNSCHSQQGAQGATGRLTLP